ncbi:MULTISPECIES: hypothetical protein [unclassified Sphingomonas]|uniref:hypothetical protein n=1 Tax=unclassified Sphingomonas TaxID=196159 RepID=UPI00226A1D81|nr:MULTISPECIES: hypothetical protein [unclassified Sphingomonas]
MSKRTFAISAATIALAAGCTTDPHHRPLLTDRALSRAAATCHVESLGLHHSIRNELPYGDYLLPAAEANADEDTRQSSECMARALKRYRFDFLGQVEHRAAK